MCCELTAKQVATVVTLCWEKERHEFFKQQANFFEILCLHVPVYRRSGDKGNKHFPDSSGRSRGRAQGACPPYFQTTMRPKGPKKNFFEPPPPATTLCEGLDPPLDSICKMGLYYPTIELVSWLHFYRLYFNY